MDFGLWKGGKSREREENIEVGLDELLPSLDLLQTSRFLIVIIVRKLKPFDVGISKLFLSAFTLFKLFSHLFDYDPLASSVVDLRSCQTSPQGHEAFERVLTHNDDLSGCKS